MPPGDRDDAAGHPGVIGLRQFERGHVVVPARVEIRGQGHPLRPERFEKQAASTPRGERAALPREEPPLPSP